MDIELLKRQMRDRRKGVNFERPTLLKKNNPKIYSFIIRVMILTVLFLGTLIFTKTSTKNKQLFYDTIFKDNISFAVINNFYNRYLGSILPFKDIVKNNEPVFKEKLEYKETNIYKDGVALSVTDDYLVPSLDSGIVIFIGDKEEYGKTVIIEQTNGIDVWYANVDNLNVKLYDYVEGGSLLGETIGNKLYLVFEKDGKKLDYKEYIK